MLLKNAFLALLTLDYQKPLFPKTILGGEGTKKRQVICMFVTCENVELKKSFFQLLLSNLIEVIFAVSQQY